MNPKTKQFDPICQSYGNFALNQHNFEQFSLKLLFPKEFLSLNFWSSPLSFVKVPPTQSRKKNVEEDKGILEATLRSAVAQKERDFYFEPGPSRVVALLLQANHAVVQPT